MLHNRERGTVTIEAEGRTYQLVLDLNALVMVEGHFSTPERPVTMIDIGRRIHSGSATYTQVLIWAAFQAHHPEVTLVEAGRLVWTDGMQGFMKTRDALVASMQADAVDLEATDQAHPPPASPDLKPAPKRSTGGASISPRAVAG